MNKVRKEVVQHKMVLSERLEERIKKSDGSYETYEDFEEWSFADRTGEHLARIDAKCCVYEEWVPSLKKSWKTGTFNKMFLTIDGREIWRVPTTL